MLVEQLSPCWSSTGLTPFLGRPGQCGYFCTTAAEGRLDSLYSLICNRGGRLAPLYSIICNRGGRLDPLYSLIGNRPKYKRDLQWNRISNLEASGSENFPRWPHT
ncbi:hypothetical protein AVEN_21364-1 [Araneus ventricosus]|uniref:Uncharacterized protein n=1 Tax=Araneus ventricosus TaxID=182803 RepID=A0A4Y2RZI4_ARAVE|nr:hypothetical protein AVEN_21364-1 [Araneus ventricosus]